MSSKKHAQEHDRGLRAFIAERGWAVQWDLEDDEGLAYTIGLGFAVPGHPELAVAGLPDILAGDLLDKAASLVAAGTLRGLRHGSVAYSVLDHGRPLLVHGPVDARRNRLAAAHRIMSAPGRSARALQLLWPDAANRFPGSPGYAGERPQAVLGPVLPG